MENRIEKLEADLRNIRDRDLYYRGMIKALVWSAAGFTALIAAYAGVTSLWHIPTLVKQTASGHASELAKEAKDAALADAKVIAEKRMEIEKIIADSKQRLEKAGVLVDGTNSNIKDSGCAIFGELQFCWGQQSPTAVGVHPSKELRGRFKFTFAKPFANRPSITTGIRIGTGPPPDDIGKYEVWNLYTVGITPERFLGTIRESNTNSADQDKYKLKSISYFAIGKSLPTGSKDD